MYISKIKTKYVMIMLTGLFLLFSAVYVNAASMLNFSGKITDVGGMELADGVYDMKFKIYDAQSGGNVLWSEDLTAGNRFGGIISSTTGRVYTYNNEHATTTLRVGQYLYNASTSEAAMIVDFDQVAQTITVASGSPVWSISQAINNRPFVEGGIINENLGSVTDIGIDFSQTRYLELEFDGEVMEPRKILDTAANAFNAERLGGQTVDVFANVNNNLSVFGQWSFDNILNVSTSSVTTALTVNQGGSGNIVSFMRGATTSFAVLPDGQVRFENYAFPVADGSAGYVLKTDGNGGISWQLDITSNSGSAWATSTNSTMIYPADTAQVVVVGSNATSTLGYRFEVRSGDALFEGATISDNLFVGGSITSGLWQGSVITNNYIASSSIWNSVYDAVTASSSQWQAGYNYRLTGASGEFTLSDNLLAINAGYIIPLTASTSQWVTAYGWGSHALAGYLIKTNNLSDLSSSSAARTNLGLVVGTNIQAYDQELSELGALIKVADKTIYLDGAGNYALTAFTTMARSLVDDTNASAMRTTLGLGTMAVISDIGATSISTLGTISSGTWQGSSINNSYIASSSIWNSTTNTVNASSSSWTSAYNIINASSTDWQNTYNTVSANAWLADVDFTANGLMVRTANGVYINRIATGTVNQIVVTNGDGVSGNPTFGLDSFVYLGANGRIGRDSNNYINFGIDNQLGFVTNNTIGMTLDVNGYLGIGTTTPSGLLTVGSISGTQFIVNNIGQVLAGEWLGKTIDIAHGGTGTSTPPTAGQLLIGNVAGEFEYISTSSLGITQDSKSYFVGTTTVISDGLFSTSTLTGYKAANDLCTAEFSGAHLCRTYDIMLTIERGNISTWTSGSAWISQGPSANTAGSNDCDGWKSNVSTDLGSFWSFDSDSGGEGWLTNCSVKKPLACCVWQ